MTRGNMIWEAGTFRNATANGHPVKIIVTRDPPPSRYLVVRLWRRWFPAKPRVVEFGTEVKVVAGDKVGIQSSPMCAGGLSSDEIVGPLEEHPDRRPRP